jgi:hypothetical protein
LDILNVQPSFVQIFELLIDTHLKINQEFNIKPESNLHRILCNIKNIILRNSNSNDAFLDLMKLIFVNSNQEWSIELFSCVVNLFGTNDIIFKTKYGLLKTFTFNTKLKYAIYNKKNKHLMEIQNYKSLLGQLLKAISTSDICLLPSCLAAEEHNKYEGIILRQKKDYSRSIEIFKSLLLCEDTLVKIDSTLELINCYIEKGDLTNCLEVLISSHFKNENLGVGFKLKEIFAAAEASQSLHGEICLPIFYDVYSKYIRLDDELVKSIAYEDLLNYYGITKPSDLLNIEQTFDQVYMIYFLRNICVLQIMDSSIWFNSSEEVERERIAVCQILIKLDPENTEDYLREVKSITQSLIIRKGMREIEKSKIFVNVDGIKKAVENNLRESYNRYQGLLNGGYTSDQPDFITITSKQEKGAQFKIPNNEKNGLLTNMILQLRNNFVSSNEYGLDCYLSVGIRHGTLAGQLRSPFAKLITSRDHVSNLYRDNEYWKEKYKCYDAISVDYVLKSLAEFSSKIDELIDLLKNKWIQIKKYNNDEGLFDYTITEGIIRLIQDKILISTPYEEFVEIVFEVLWSMTEINLANVRDSISYELKKMFNDVFNLLQRKLDEVKFKIDLLELNYYIYSSRTTIQYELDRIANWFKLAATTEIPLYTLDIALNIALEMLKSIYSNEAINPEVKIDEKINIVEISINKIYL